MIDPERFQRTRRLAEMLVGKVQVNRRLFQIAMAQQDLNRAQIRAGLEQVCGKAMPPMPRSA
jgi:hypothetical protein